MTDSAPRHGARGVVEGIKGRVKEAFGSLTGRRGLVREGEAQQDRADAEREVAKHETEAARARAEAEIEEARQEGHQRQQRT
jgi:uncharacterized protein YjbJ (UPF0337 family)